MSTGMYKRMERDWELPWSGRKERLFVLLQRKRERERGESWGENPSLHLRKRKVSPTWFVVNCSVGLLSIVAL